MLKYNVCKLKYEIVHGPNKFATVIGSSSTRWSENKTPCVSSIWYAAKQVWNSNFSL